MNKEKSIEWLIKAGENGHFKAQFNLGSMYFMGEELPKDLEKALYWFEKAAALGNSHAKNNVEVIKMLLNKTKPED